MKPIFKHPEFMTYELNLANNMYTLVIHNEFMMFNVSHLSEQFRSNAFKEKLRSIKTVFILESLSQKLTGKSAITISGLTVSEAMSEENKTNKDIYDINKSYHRIKTGAIEFINPEFIRIIKIASRTDPQVQLINGFYLDIRSLFIMLCLFDSMFALYHEEIVQNIEILCGKNNSVQCSNLSNNEDEIVEKYNESSTEETIIKYDEQSKSSSEIGFIGENLVLDKFKSEFHDIQNISAKPHQMNLYIPSKDVRFEVKNQKKIKYRDFERFIDDALALHPRLSIFVSCNEIIETRIMLDPLRIYCNISDFDNKLFYDFIIRTIHNTDTIETSVSDEKNIEAYDRSFDSLTPWLKIKLEELFNNISINKTDAPSKSDSSINLLQFITDQYEYFLYGIYTVDAYQMYLRWRKTDNIIKYEEFQTEILKYCIIELRCTFISKKRNNYVLKSDYYSLRSATKISPIYFDSIEISNFHYAMDRIKNALIDAISTKTNFKKYCIRRYKGASFTISLYNLLKSVKNDSSYTPLVLGIINDADISKIILENIETIQNNKLDIYDDISCLKYWKSLI